VRIGEEEIRCQAIATAAHDELAEAEPLLLKANDALEQLTKRDIGEVKAYVHPPSAVEKVMKALMILSQLMMKTLLNAECVSFCLPLSLSLSVCVFRRKRRHVGRSQERFGQCRFYQNIDCSFANHLSCLIRTNMLCCLEISQR
jgi:hypothetical protein